MVVGIPILGRFTSDIWTVAVERILHVDINGFAEALQLPVARHGNLIPLAHIVVLTVEVSRSRFRVFAPMEQPLPVERNDFLTLLLFRGQLQRGVIRQFVDAQHVRVLPVVS